MATIKDVSRETGLSLATISKYINGHRVKESNRVIIEEAIERLGFTANELARSLKTKRSRSIGVVIPHLSVLFITGIISQAEDILRKNGYSVVVCTCRNDAQREKEAVRFLMGKSVDGIVNMPISSDGQHLAPALEKGIPVVLIDRMIPGMQDKVNSVLVDNVSGAADAVSLLLDAGHHNVGIILGPQDVFTSQQRQLGYAQAMIQHGLLPNNEHIIYSDYTVKGGYKSMKALLKKKEVTAVFVSNFEMTLGAIIAVNDLSVKIPEDISFIGFDSMLLAQAIQPQLTIISQPLEEIGEAVAQTMLDQLSQEPEKRQSKIITLPTGLLQGGSIRRLS